MREPWLLVAKAAIGLAWVGAMGLVCRALGLVP
jgi:hypothetical protein